MSDYGVYNNSRRKVAQIKFKSYPPDTEGIIFTPNGTIGVIVSNHAKGNGTIVSTTEKHLGGIGKFSSAIFDDKPCIFEDSLGVPIGAVKNAYEITKGVDPAWAPAFPINSSKSIETVGKVQLENWTSEDEEGVRQAAIEAGRLRSHDIKFLVEGVQTKHRNLAGAAALLANLL